MNNQVKVIIAGGREFTDYSLLRRICDQMLSGLIANSEVTIVSGGARGVDRLGERYARERDIDLIVMNADWDTYGKSAGYRRNQDMSHVATHLIAFWDGNSRGTKHMIDIAKKDGLLRCVFDFNGKQVMT